MCGGFMMIENIFIDRNGDGRDGRNAWSSKESECVSMI